MGIIKGDSILLLVDALTCAMIFSFTSLLILFSKVFKGVELNSVSIFLMKTHDLWCTDLIKLFYLSNNLRKYFRKLTQDQVADVEYHFFGDLKAAFSSSLRLAVAITSYIGTKLTTVCSHFVKM